MQIIKTLYGLWIDTLYVSQNKTKSFEGNLIWERGKTNIGIFILCFLKFALFEIYVFGFYFSGNKFAMQASNSVSTGMPFLSPSHFLIPWHSDCEDLVAHTPLTHRTSDFFLASLLPGNFFLHCNNLHSNKAGTKLHKCEKQWSFESLGFTDTVLKHLLKSFIGP